MKDYIKELNIIDFLGIIVPGSLLVLLVTGDNTQLLLWADYFGVEATIWIKGLFLLIAGYLAGMVLHEIGDQIERGTWCFHVLDPKAYAANAVGPRRLEDALINTGILESSEKKQAFSYVLPPWLKGILGVLAALTVLVFSSLGFCWAMNASCRIYDNSSGTSVPLRAYVGVCALLGLCVTSIVILVIGLRRRYGGKIILTDSLKKKDWDRIHKHASKFRKRTFSIAADEKQAWKEIDSICKKYNSQDEEHTPEENNEEKLNWTLIQNICILNPEIQTYVTVRGIHSKQNIFDSFRHAMRNLIICIAVVNAYSIWHPVEVYQDIAGYFIRRGSGQSDFFGLCMWFAFIVFVMFIRYNHYVFLRYKYGFENFVEKAKKHEESVKDETATVYVQIVEPTHKDVQRNGYGQHPDAREEKKPEAVEA